MRKFLCNTVKLLIPVFIIVIVYSIVYSRKVQITVDRYVFQDTVKVLVAGDSHLNSGINPSFLPNSKSIAQGGECYFYTYYKVKWYLEHSNQVEQVLVGCSYHNFTDFWDDFLYDWENSIEMYSRYSSIIDRSGNLKLLRKPILYIYKFCSEKIKFPHPSGIKTIRMMDDNNVQGLGFLGGYRSLETTNLNDTILQNMISNSFHNKGSIRKISEIQYEFFTRLIELCDEKKVELVFIGSPIHNSLDSNIPEILKEEFSTIINSTDRYIYIDKINMQLPDSCFYDFSHLNANGAKVFTEEIFESMVVKL